MNHHDLKTWPTFFEAVWRGDKTFEVRLDDRGFQKGDTVALREWDRRRACACIGVDHDEVSCGKYTGRRIQAQVGHVLASTPPRGSQRGFNGNGYVVFSLIDQKRVDQRSAAEPMERIATSLGRDAAL